LLIQQLESITQNIQAGVPEKHYADNSKKMKILYDKLTNGQIEPEVVGILHRVCEACAAAVPRHFICLCRCRSASWVATPRRL